MLLWYNCFAIVLEQGSAIRWIRVPALDKAVHLYQATTEPTAWIWLSPRSAQGAVNQTGSADRDQEETQIKQTECRP